MRASPHLAAVSEAAQPAPQVDRSRHHPQLSIEKANAPLVPMQATTAPPSNPTRFEVEYRRSIAIEPHFLARRQSLLIMRRPERTPTGYHAGRRHTESPQFSMIKSSAVLLPGIKPDGLCDRKARIDMPNLSYHSAGQSSCSAQEDGRRKRRPFPRRGGEQYLGLLRRLARNRSRRARRIDF